MGKVTSGTAQILVRNEDKLVMRAFETTDTITMNGAGVDPAITVVDNSGNSVMIWAIGQEKNSTNMTVYNNVTLPSGYESNKYEYDGSSFTVNAYWQPWHSNNPLGWIQEAVNDSVTTLKIIDAKNQLEVGDTLRIDDEKMTVASIVDLDTITVTRGAASTTAAAHLSKMIFKI